MNAPAPLTSVLKAGDLHKIGRALYGEAWLPAMARDLGIRERSIVYMTQGRRAIHAGIIADLLAVAERRQAELGPALKLMEKALRRGRQTG